MTDHTKTPWRYIGDDDGDFVVLAGEEHVANVGHPFQEISTNPKTLVAFDLDQADAAFIIRTANSHDALVAALNTIAEGMTNKFPGAPDVMQTTLAEFQRAMWLWSQEVARAALKPAEDGT